MTLMLTTAVAFRNRCEEEDKINLAVFIVRYRSAPVLLTFLYDGYRSAYHQFSRVNNPIIKEELIKEGKDTSLGALVSVVSAKVSIVI